MYFLTEVSQVHKLLQVDNSYLFEILIIHSIVISKKMKYTIPFFSPITRLITPITFDFNGIGSYILMREATTAAFLILSAVSGMTQIFLDYFH